MHFRGEQELRHSTEDIFLIFSSRIWRVCAVCVCVLNHRNNQNHRKCSYRNEDATRAVEVVNPTLKKWGERENYTLDFVCVCAAEECVMVRVCYVTSVSSQGTVPASWPQRWRAWWSPHSVSCSPAAPHTPPVLWCRCTCLASHRSASVWCHGQLHHPSTLVKHTIQFTPHVKPFWICKVINTENWFVWSTMLHKQLLIWINGVYNT